MDLFFFDNFRLTPAMNKVEKIMQRIASNSLKPLSNQFVNEMMRNGDKKTAQKIIQETFDTLLVNNRSRDDFDVAVMKVSPLVKTTSKKRGGKNVLFPKPLDARQQSKIGIQWIIENATKSGKKGIFKCNNRY